MSGAKPVSIVLGIGFAITLLVLASCSDPAPRPFLPSGYVFFDPHLNELGTRTDLYHDFSHRSLIRLGRGWFSPEDNGTVKRAWVSKRSFLYFSTLPGERVEFVARCAPFTYDGAPQQELVPIFNGYPLQRIPLQKGLREIRFPLPQEYIRAPIDTLELRFSYSAVPAQVISGSRDPRHISAFFETMAIETDPPHGDGGVHGADFDIARRVITLRSFDQGVRIPLPASDTLTIRLREVSGSGDALLALRLLEPGGESEVIWQGEPDAATDLRLETRRSGQGPARLELRLVAKSPASAPPDEVEIVVGPDFITAEDIPRWPVSFDKPPIFIYLVDTLRADGLEIYGNLRPTSPRINEFAQDAVVFERAWSASAWTLPATVSVLTGLNPGNHGFTKAGIKKVPRQSHFPRLPEFLQQSGYETVGISQTYVASDIYGLDKGFDRFYLNEALTHRGQYSGIVRWFLWSHLLHRGRDARPLFTYIHTVAPHALYEPRGDDRAFAEENPGQLRPERYNPHLFMRDGFDDDPREVTHLRALYDGEVRYADREFGAFLDLLKYTGIYDQSLIVLVSDHGEEFYEHGGFDHSTTLYEELLHIPLVVKFPYSDHAGKRISARVSMVDIFPTLFDLLGEKPPAGAFDGKSLYETFGADASRGRIVSAETSPEGKGGDDPGVDIVAIAAGDIKCILYRNETDRFSNPISRFEVFDLATDPGEQQPLALTDERASNCVAALERWSERLGPSSSSAESERLSEAERERLRALGYLE